MASNDPRRHSDHKDGNDNGEVTASASEDMTTDDDLEWEEYEWAGQKRIRASSLFRGGFPDHVLGDSTMISRKDNTAEDDVDDEVDIDGDETQQFGSPQYKEEDVGEAIALGKTIASPSKMDMSDHDTEEAPSAPTSKLTSGSIMEVDATVWDALTARVRELVGVIPGVHSISLR